MATIILKGIVLAFVICMFPESYGLNCFDGGSQTLGTSLPSSKDCSGGKICKNETKRMGIKLII